MQKVTIPAPRRGGTALMKHTPVILAAGGLVSIVITFILFAVLAFFTADGILPEEYISAEVLAVSFAASFIGAGFVTKRIGVRKFLFAMVFSGSLFVFFFVFGRAFSGEASIGGLTPKLLLSVLGGGALSGFFTAVRKSPKPRKR